MLLEAVAIDDPVIFCEHKYLYYHLKADRLPTPDDPPALPIGRARIARAGRDATVVTYSAMVHEALAAADTLAEEGIEMEVVDLRTVKPLDTDTVLASVARTGRLLCVGEAFPWGGVTAEVVARVAQEGFPLLDAPPRAAQRAGYSRAVPSAALGGAPARRGGHRQGRAGIAEVLSMTFASAARGLRGGGTSSFLHPPLSPLTFPMRVPIIMPQLGESIAEATIVNIAVKPGDHVAADQEIIEVETNKALLHVTTPCAGEIAELTAEPQETYEVGATLGFIEAVPDEVARAGIGRR